MRILFFSDWRIQPLKWIDWMLEETGPVDMILYGGDDTRRFAPQVKWSEDVLEMAEELMCNFDLESAIQLMAELLEQKPIVEHFDNWRNDAEVVFSPSLILRFFEPVEDNHFHQLAKQTKYGLGGVVGNDCLPEDRLIFSGKNVYNLHTTPIKADVWGIVGIEGNIVSTQPDGTKINNKGFISFPDTEVRKHLEKSMQTIGVDSKHLIIVSHTPPRNYLDFAFRFGAGHIGSPSLTEFIETHAPALVLCGHVHSQGGRSCYIGSTLVVNAASSDNKAIDARGALIELEDGRPPVVRWLEPGKRTIISIPGIGQETERKLAAVGIETVEAFLSASFGQLLDAGFGLHAAARLSAKAQAHRNHSPVWLDKKQVRVPERVVCYDVETNLIRFGADSQSEPWLIGASIGGEFVQWEALDEDPALRKKMLDSFFDYCEANGGVVCSWSLNGFDDNAIQAGLERWFPYGRKRWDRIKKLNLCKIMKGALELPLSSWSIKDVSRLLGWRGEDSEWDGLLVGIAYNDYLQSGKHFDVDGVKRYNQQAVEQLAFVYRWYCDAVRSKDAESRNAAMAPRIWWPPHDVEELKRQMDLGLSPYEIEIPGYTVSQILRKMYEMFRNAAITPRTTRHQR